MKQQESNLDNYKLNIPLTLAATIGRYIEGEIIEGRLESGAKLSPEEIAQNFEVSKIPVREALMALKEEGLVSLKPRMGFFVAVINLEDIEQIYAIRTVLYPFVFKTILENGFEQDLLKNAKRILNMMKERVEAGDVEGYFSHVNQLSDLYLGICPNVHLVKIINNLGKKILRMRFMSLSKIQYIKDSLSLHMKVFNAFKRKDVDKTVKNAEAIIIRGLDVLRETFPN